MKNSPLYYFLLALFFFSSLDLIAQRTVGLFKKTDQAFLGYTLFTPIQGTDVYLVDNCGDQVNKWDLEGRPGMMSYIDHEGNLYRAERVASDFNGGGTGGRIRKYDWDGNQIWTFDLSQLLLHQHHDLALLPNGNFLTIQWELFTKEQVIEMGRDPQLVEEEIWMEKIIELKPIGEDQAEEVWSWRLVDHLIQDFDVTKENFGVVKDHPELLDINFTGGANSGGIADWIHLNGIDYNEELDQIILSSRHLSEVWIIDHSTTTEEATTHSGGDTNMGGDILYRWGNPISYRRGDENDQVSYKQHDATWIKLGEEQRWGFSIYNNGQGRPGPDFSQVDLINLPINTDKTYFISDTLAFAPTTPEITIDLIDGEQFYNSNISGSELLPNGNALICVGGIGNFYEVDTTDMNLHWHYVVPLSADIPIEQGNISTANTVFKTRRYALDYPGFDNVDLTPVGPIETNPIIVSCQITSTKEVINSTSNFRLYPNPTSGELFIDQQKSDRFNITVYNSLGALVYQENDSSKSRLDLTNYPPGLYFINLNFESFKITIQ